LSRVSSFDVASSMCLAHANLEEREVPDELVLLNPEKPSTRINPEPGETLNPEKPLTRINPKPR